MSWIKLHLLVEEKDEEWKSPHIWKCYGPSLYPQDPLYRSKEDTERVTLFSTLGNWRKEYLIKDYPTIRGLKLPDNLSDKTSQYLEDLEILRARVLNPSHILNFPWKRNLKQSIKMSPEEYDHWKVTGVVPKSVEQTGDIFRTKEAVHVVKSKELWGKEWLNYSLKKIKMMDRHNSRIICAFTEEE